jgi:hypothetical protein
MDFLRGFGAFLDIRYWFNPQPVPLGPSLVTDILLFFAWFVAAGVVLRVLAKVLRKSRPYRADVARRLATACAWTGIFGLLSLFFAYEQIPLLGMRLWFLCTILYFLWHLGRIAWYLTREYPEERREEEDRLRILKYLPHRK